MPVPSKTLATSKDSLPPLPPRVTSRLGMYLTNTFLVPPPQVLTERARSENNHPCVKLPQFQFVDILRETGTDLITEATRLLAEETMLRILAKQPYSLLPHQVRLTVCLKVFSLQLPWHVRDAMAYDEMHYVWVHVELLEDAPHLRHLDLQKFHPPSDLSAHCQSYRKALYDDVQSTLLNGNIIPLHGVH